MNTMRRNIHGTDNDGGHSGQAGAPEQLVNRFAKSFALFLSFAGLLLGATNANALVCTSVATGNWGVAGTWTSAGNCNRVPNAADTVTIATGHTVTVNVATANVLSVTVNTGAILTQSSALNSAGVLNVAGTLNSTNTMAIGGATTVTGALNITAATGTRTFTGLVTVNAGGVWNNSINEPATFGGGIANDGTFAGGTGTQTFSATQSISGASPINFGGIVAVANGVTVTNNNTNVVTIAGNLTGGNATSTWVNAANSTLNYGGAAAPMGTRVFTANANPNTVNYTGAAQTVKLPSGAPATYYNLALSSSGIKTMPATAMTVADNFTMSGTATTTAAQALTVGSDFTIGATNTFAAGAFAHSVGGNWSNSGTFTAGTSTVTFNGGGAQTIGGAAATTFNNLTVANTGTGSTTLLLNTAVAGNLSVNSGTLDLSTFTANRTAAGGTITVVNGSTLKIGGVSSFPTNYTTHTLGATSTVEYSGTNQSVAAEAAPGYGNLTLSGSGTKTAAGSFTIRGNLTISGVTLGSGTFTQTVNGNVSNTGTHTATTGSITLSGGAAAHALSGNGTYANLILNDALGATLSGSPTVSGTLTLTAGTFAVGANTLTLNGPTIAGTPTNLATTSSSSLVFGGASAGVLVPSSVGALNNLTINNASGVTLSGSPTLGGTLTLTSGTLTVGANTLTLNGPAIAGTSTNLATTASSSLSFGGSSAGVFLPSSVTVLNNLTVNNSNGLTLNSSPVLSGVLTLTSGMIAAGANVLEVVSSCATGISGGSASSFVLGNLRLHYPTNASTTTCIFHIGDATAYTPVTVAMTGVTSTLANSILTARTDAGDHADTTANTSGVDPAKSVNRNWTLTSGAALTFASYDATFTFLTSDIDGGATTGNFIVGRKSGTWSYPNVGLAGANSTSAIGITQAGGFGAFAIGEAKLVPAMLFGEWHMDESLWNGTAGEVKDSAGSNHGTAATLTTPLPTTANTTPAIVGSPGTCRYGVFDRTKKNYVALPASFPNLGTSNSFTITAWIRTTDNTLGAQRIFIDDEQIVTSGYGLSLAEGGTGMLRFYTRGTPSSVILDTGNVIASNTWYFVAAVADVPNKLKRVYVYNTAGTLLANVSATWTEANFGAGDTGIASIGGETNASVGENTNAFGFAGNIDEVRVYQSALSAAHVNQVRQITRACVPPLDHISIEHANGQGLTCTPSTLTIKACSDVACSTLYTGGVVGTLTATGAPTVNWVGGSGFSIPSGSGSGSKDVQITTAGDVVFGTQAGAVAPAPSGTSPTCNFGSPSCTFTASSAGGFVVSVPNHVSCVPQVPTVTVPAACGTALNGVKSIGFRFSYVNPDAGAPPTPHVPYAGLVAPGTALATGSDSYFSLTFNSSGVATLPYFVYDDAGSLTLTANYTGSGADAGLNMTGISNPFVVAPATFGFSGIPAAPLTAGQAFNATVTAMNACATPAATPNFNQTVTITSSNPQPAMGNATAINTTLSGFSIGAASTNLIWNEVGTIDLNANLANYLGSALSVSGTQAGVGRFHPAYFDTVVMPGCGTFTYAGLTTPVKAGQPFTVTVKAKRFGGDTTDATNTANYAGATNAYLTTLSNAGVTTGLATNTIAATSFGNGVGSANVTYEVATIQTAPITLTLRATDSDTPAVSSSGHTEGATEIRSGRAKLGNAHGSELLNLPIPFRAEYWNNGWVLNSADSCTGDVSLGAGNAVSVTLSSPSATCVQDSGNPGLSSAGCATAGPAAQRFKKAPGIGFAGDFNLWLRAPGAGNTGAVTVIGNVPAWLQYPWIGGAAINPTARATFGIYKGANEFIYMRENY